AQPEMQLKNPAAGPVTGLAPSSSDARKISVKSLVDAVTSNPEALFGPPKTVTETVGGNVNVSKTAGNQDEPAIAINPKDPNRVVVVSNQDAVKGGISVSIRDDAGNWTQKLV